MKGNRIESILVTMGFAKPEEIKAALVKQKQSGGSLGEILVKDNVITPDQLIQVLAKQMGLEYIEIEGVEIGSAALDLVTAMVAEQYNLMPVATEDGTLTLAVGDPDQIIGLQSELPFAIPKVKSFKFVLANPEAIKATRIKHYGKPDDDLLRQAEAKAGIDTKGGKEVTAITQDQILADAKSAPVVKLLNLILLNAVKGRGSDIHFETFEHSFRVRYRVDGTLYEMEAPSLNLARALISRIKVLAHLDIAEMRLPQDGRIAISVEGVPVDLRVAVAPVVDGESVVMRVLDRSQINLDLERLGFRPDELDTFRKLLKKPHGIILVTGPTGSGKTTTLYAALNEMNNPEDKFITVEDPVEYDLEGIEQIQVNTDIGVGFAAVLREILRHDPDIILIGEIRDYETADIAVQASLTGHLVFTTLHTNDAPSAITRLIDLGLEPYLITATLEGIVAQRLVKRICTECKKPYEPADDELEKLGLNRSEIGDRTFSYGTGCPKCNKSGYKGRVAIFEILRTSPRIVKLILDRAPISTIRKQSVEEGMRTLRTSALNHLYDGVTTVEEVVKETIGTL